MRCCVVIPVGPGHEKLALRAKASVQQAVAHGMGAFDGVEVLCQDDSGGLGRSRARNLAVGQAGRMAADWIFFLDADDLMHPHAFEAVAGFLPGHDAVWARSMNQVLMDSIRCAGRTRLLRYRISSKY